jgi:ubiquinol oxidase
MNACSCFCFAIYIPCYHYGMESDSFTQHHPHTLGDYFSRSIVLFVYRFAKIVFGSSYIEHALVLESALVSMQTSAAAHVQYAAIRHLRADRELIEELLGEASGGHLHVLVLKRFTVVSWYAKAGIWKIQFSYVPFFRLLYVLSPRTAHRLVAYAHERLAGIYADLLLGLISGSIENKTAPPIATQYWNLPEGASLIELVNQLIADTAKNRDYNHLLADSK